MKTKVLVRGPFLTQSGYGEHARFVLRALKSKEELFDIYAISTNWGKVGWLSRDDEERRWFDELINKTVHYLKNEGRFDLSLQVTVPNEFQKLAPTNIGVTAGIEVSQVHPVWIEKSQLMDKIITISEHSRDTFVNTVYSAKNQETGEVFDNFRTHVDFGICHYPVKNIAPKELDLDFDYDFNFLTVAQWGPRKNLENTIKWFVEEFIDQKVGLIVKASTLNNSLYDRELTQSRMKNLLAKYPKRECKVYLLHGDMEEAELAALYTHDKVKGYVTITHGEGFGLPLFEAAYSGLPVIAPAWSGHLDFLCMKQTDKKGKVKIKPMFSVVDHKLVEIPPEACWKDIIVEGSKWCEPEQGSYKMRMREMYKDYGRFKKRAKALQEWVLDEFREDKMYENFIEKILSFNEVIDDIIIL